MRNAIAKMVNAIRLQLWAFGILDSPVKMPPRAFLPRGCVCGYTVTGERDIRECPIHQMNDTDPS